MNAPVVIVGAGAAGLMAAIVAAGQGPTQTSTRRVLLLERTADGGRKILISGGGRCNILPSALHPERFVTASPPHVMRGMLRAWPLAAQQAFFETEAGVPLALEVESGKLFPRSNRARDVRDALVSLAVSRGVETRFSSKVTGLAPADGGWHIDVVESGVSRTMLASRVVLATGGLSVPMTGSDGTGLRLAARLGHAIHDTYPALTPLLSGGSLHAQLAGVSCQVRLRARSGGKTTEARGGFLFTHRGYSGPSVLDVSHVLVRDSAATLRASWSDRGAGAWETDLTGGAVNVSTVLARHLPARLADALAEAAGLPPDRRTSDLRRSERTALIDRLTSFELPWNGDEGYKKAEVTGGGVALTEIDPRTMESRRHPGLFLCGEMLDAFGPIGGYNFAWAWATGRAAGLAAGALA